LASKSLEFGKKNAK